MNQRYKIKATGEILELKSIETVENYPNDTTVYVLSDGSRWSWDDFFKYLSPYTSSGANRDDGEGEAGAGLKIGA